MIQTWILPDNGWNAYKNVVEGHDSAVCGTCLLRPTNGGGCYVQVAQAPNGISKKLMRGGYEELQEIHIQKYIKGERLRIGSYGDPTAIPLEIWENLLKSVSGHTGYTQFWANPRNQDYKRILMASVRSEAQAQRAMDRGWRYYRIRDQADPLMKKEVVCPASKEANYKATCAQCLLCDGTSRNKKLGIAIIAHGSANILTGTKRALSAGDTPSEN